LVAWILFALRYLKRRAPGDIPRAVVSLIAGISLLDAVLIAGAGAPTYAALATLGFLLTLALQRLVPGT
jgi:4-hydroxybenzoate polyprenyltransferase